MGSDFWLQEYGPGRLPGDELVGEIEGRVREALPENYRVVSDEEVLEDKGDRMLDKSVRTEYRVLGPEGEIASFEFVSFPNAEKMDWFTAEAEASGQAFYRVKRVFDGVYDDLEEHHDFDVRPEERTYLLHFEGKRGIELYDEGEVDDFQEVVRELEKDGVARIDPRLHDRDLFYGNEWGLGSDVHMLSDNQEALLDEVEDTELEWGGKVSINEALLK